MHMRRQVRNAVAERLKSIENVKDVRNRRVLGGLDERQLPLISVFDSEDLTPEILASRIPGQRPTFRAFRLVVAVVGTTEQEEDGVLDDVCVELEKRLLANDGNPVRDLASAGIEYGGGIPVVGEGEDPIYAFAMVWDFKVPMGEGKADRKG